MYDPSKLKIIRNGNANFIDNLINWESVYIPLNGNVEDGFKSQKSIAKMILKIAYIIIAKIF